MKIGKSRIIPKINICSASNVAMIDYSYSTN